ncbi:MAG: PAAR-like domain-containing protein, partial [Pseudomonadota bacterium]
MASTIGANGLSIVHKGSGGEANASVPDVCLTKVGKPVVPIPYGNNAKSADLVDGSTSVTADGGNSIALQGSKFSKSTGDAAGDKKGVSSGTIEGEAQFVTSSPNVLIEGKGVARQSDQMTMNNGNTMCFGVQNPSFSVEEDLEETFIMDVCVRHPNGQRLVNAPFKLSDEQGSTVYEATLDEKGRSDADPLKGGKVKLLVEESQDPFVVTPVRRDNPRHIDSQSDDDFFNIASKGQRGFWQPTRIETVGTAWGSIGQTLSSDRYFQDMVSAEVIQHFTHYHPDTTFDVSKTCDALIGNLDQPLPHTTESLLAYTLPQVLEEGELLSVLLRLAPHETTDRMLAYMRARGKGNPQTYLADYDWQAAEKSINSELDALLNKLKSRLTFLRDEASKLQYAYLSEDVFDKHIDTLSSYMKLLPDLISGVFNKMQTKASELLANTDNVKVIKAADDLHSIESESIEAVVNTTKTIDTVEPFMNEVAGVIENVIPIYPVRYGYANFFDELMPAQAPPSMTEMSGATGLKDTGGYLLRLLREGWLYIKEESEEETAPFHIFKYAQTETATGVIEKFEKYYFTNEENAQEGLTLDTSSGSTFYPFAFVTPKAKKISIVYSEHEWSAAIIDNMNNDEELRKKAMQQVDLTAQQTEFSQAATQDNLSALVEDYRNNDEKWLADKDSAKPMPHGLDLATTTLSYHLDAEGIVETMQKSHSEHKDGALVVLFDPVGRQRDLNHVLSFNVAD